MSLIEESGEVAGETQAPEIDSKYRLIILAAKRSKQRIALEEVMRGRVNFTVNTDGQE